jgi:Thioesterase-like superfamily
VTSSGPLEQCFYVPLDTDGRRWRATRRTAGPWSRDAQHAGPPSALLGRSVELLEASLSAAGRDVMTVRAWRVLRTDVSTGPLPPAPAIPPADAALPVRTSRYLGAVDWRIVSGSFEEPGPAALWTRLTVAVVDGEEPTGLQRVLAVADSGNGVSSVLDWREHYFINPELTVHLHREPRGEWVLLDAVTTISPGGAGLAASVLSDVDGEVGRGAQSLLVAPRVT